MKIIVQQTVNDQPQESVTLGEIKFYSSSEDEDTFSIREHPLQRGDLVPLVVSAAYSSLNQSLSIFIVCEGEHVFTAMCRWNVVAPYFAFRLKDGSFIECYFAK